jgi:chromate transporter
MSASQFDPIAPARASVAEVFRVFLMLGLSSFGGPVAHLGYFHRELVQRRCWVSEAQYAQLLAICQFLPGPASSQLGFSLGLLRAGWGGGLAAFVAFTTPSVLLLLLFAAALPWLTGSLAEAALHGLKLVACVVVGDALLSMARKLCPDPARRVIALCAALLMFWLDATWAQMLVLILGAAGGLYWCRNTTMNVAVPIPVAYGRHIAWCAMLLFLVLLGGLLVGAPELPGLLATAEAFYRAGALVFGGGHVVLPLLEQSVVGTGWVSGEAFLAGYGAAQIIPGPMFAFSAYLGALVPGDHPSWLSATTALLCMFLPGFLLLIAALPLWQTLVRHASALKVISGVNAAVVGLLAAALIDPVLLQGVRSIVDAGIVALGLALLLRWRLHIGWVVLFCVLSSVLKVPWA